jgi:hypothetical protein
VRASSISNKSIRWVYCAVFVAIAKQYVYYAHDVLAKKKTPLLFLAVGGVAMLG